MINARDALQRLRDGNQRFVAGVSNDAAMKHLTQRNLLIDGQHPFAVILGCSDSRVPVEIVFDQGLGDLFVIRIAGNIVSRSQIGSVEFAAQKLGARLVVVLGHTRCGAIDATLSALLDSGDKPSGDLGFIVDFIRPSVERRLAGEHSDDFGELAGQIVRDNVLVSTERLRQKSRVLEDMTRNDGLMIVGAEYSIETGEVDFFENG